MKYKIFEQVAINIAKHLDITPQELFEKNQETHLVMGRHFLYHICHERGMKVADIQKYMHKNNHPITHPTILYGLEKMEEHLKDLDLKKIVDKVSRVNV